MQIASLPTIAKISAFLLKVVGHEKGKGRKKKKKEIAHTRI